MSENRQETLVAFEEKNEKMPKWFPFAWSSRGFSLSVNVMLVGYITFYSTDVLGLNALTIGMVLLVSKLIDAVTDICVGFVIEKTHTKWGKGRPYEIFILGMWFFTVLLFSVPDVDAMGQYIYIFIMYALVNSICATFVNGDDAVYFVRAVPSKKNQITVLTVKKVLRNKVDDIKDWRQQNNSIRRENRP
jgi:GPH family glycoside/pentoside/hexuronide:cation symporter